jgi:CDK inhibitor PHO81
VWKTVLERAEYLTDHSAVDPVLLCNDLGQIRDLTPDIRSHPVIQSSGRASMSIKESARIAQSNNLMGLICRSSLLVRSI